MNQADPGNAHCVGEAAGQGWWQMAELAAAFVLCSTIGLERELRQKSAGLRTHALVGLGSALFMLVSKYGFSDVLGQHVVLDPSRVAAQIVSGIGFVGAGLIFVRRDSVRGLTTAASIWITAAVGAACGAGLLLLALVVTVGYFLIATLIPRAVRMLPGRRWQHDPIFVEYLDGHGVLRDILLTTTRRGFVVTGVDVYDRDTDVHTVSVVLDVGGRGDSTELTAELAELTGVSAARTGDPDR